MADVEAPRDINQSFAPSPALQRLLPLMHGELELTPEPNATLLRTLATLIGQLTQLVERPGSDHPSILAHIQSSSFCT